MDPLGLKVGDTAVVIRAPLADEAGPVPLLGATVRFHMKQERGSKAVNGVAVVEDPPGVPADEVGTWAAYYPTALDLDTPGVFRGEFTVTFADGKQETFPSGPGEADAYIPIVIRALAT